MTSNVQALRDRLVQDAVTRLETVIERFLPDLQVPQFFAGHRIGPNDASEIAYVLTQLRASGVGRVAGRDVSEIVVAMLKQISPTGLNGFYSYRIAETILGYGPFDGNPLLTDFTDAQKSTILKAIDATGMYDPASGTLRGFPNNYWGVLARCEFARQKLGVLTDTTILDLAVSKIGPILLSNPLGFFDDDFNGGGRYDIYSADTHLFLEPLWDRFDQKLLRRNLEQHVKFLECVALENGITVAYGRSIGALSVCLTIELAAVGLRHGMGDASRLLGLAENAREKLCGWYEDGLISAHRHRMTYGYRGPHRLLQMTLDVIGKLTLAAVELTHAIDDADETAHQVPPPPGEVRWGRGASVGSVETGSASAAPTQPPPEGEEKNRHAVDLFPPRDELWKYDARHAGVWVFRNADFAFQFPLVGGSGADYMPWFHSPGLFENPVDSPLLCGVPRVSVSDQDYAPAGLPARAEKTPSGLRIAHDQFLRINGTGDAAPLPARREVSYRIDGDTIVADEHWQFDALPAAITFDFAEARRPLNLQIETDAKHHYAVIETDGSPPYRSFWGPLKRWHQVTFAPAKEIRFSYRLSPSVRTANVPAGHDYQRALYDEMPRGAVAEIRRESFAAGSDDAIDAWIGDADVVHVGWPEHLVQAEVSPEEIDRRHARVIEKLAATKAKVVWTMHNRRPHHWELDRGLALYKLWAPIVDGVIHHSQWGMKLIRGELPYKSSARHVVIPHGHFGKQMPRLQSREALEAKFKLPQTAIRLGVLGRPQKTKQIDLLVKAFIAVNRDDQQLVLTATPEDPSLLDHPRVFLLPRNKWMLRPEIAEHTQVCDALLSAHSGLSYLTSGITADAVGLGLAMLVPDWEFFRETLGDAAIYHDNTEAGIARAITSLDAKTLREKKSAMTALQPATEWATIAAKTAAFLRDVARS